MTESQDLPTAAQAGRKSQDSRFQALKQAIEEFARKKAEEERLKKEQEEREKLPFAIKGREPKTTEGKTKAEVIEWPKLNLAQWMGKGKEGREKRPRRLDSGTMAQIIITERERERAKALERPLPNPHDREMKRELIQETIRKRERREGMRREILFLLKLIQLLKKEGLFHEDEEQEEWSLGQVKVFVDKVLQEGWTLLVAALERSYFMREWGLSDMLGVYQAKLDNQAILEDYIRITPDKVEEYLGNKEQMNKAQLNFLSGDGYKLRGEDKKALAEYRKAKAQLYFISGEGYKSEGDYDQALASYIKAIELDSSLVKAHNNLGMMYKIKGEYESALAQYEEVANLVEAHNKLAKIHKRKREYKEASAEYEKVAELTPVSVQAHHNLGVIYAELGLIEQATAAYEKAIELDPRNPEVHDDLGAAYEEQGDYEAAEEEHKKATQLSSELKGD